MKRFTKSFLAGASAVGFAAALSLVIVLGYVPGLVLRLIGTHLVNLATLAHERISKTIRRTDRFLSL